MIQAGRGRTSLEKQAWSVLCALRVSSTSLLMLTVMARSQNQEKVLLNTFFKKSEAQLLHWRKIVFMVGRNRDQPLRHSPQMGFSIQCPWELRFHKHLWSRLVFCCDCRQAVGLGSHLKADALATNDSVASSVGFSSVFEHFVQRIEPVALGESGSPLALRQPPRNLTNGVTAHISRALPR